MAQPLPGPLTDTPTFDRHAGAPDADLLARAAEVLGVTASVEPTAQSGPFQLMVTVVGPERRSVRHVPADVPVGQIASLLGAAVGVEVVSSVSLRDGRGLSPSVTLAEAGVRNASVILVDAPEAPRRAAGSPSWVGQGFPGNPRGGHRSPPATNRHTRPGPGSPARWLTLGAGLVAIVVISAFVGAAVFGTNSTASTAPDGAKRLAARAAAAWMAGKAFGGPRLAGVPADLGRVGPAVGGSLEEVGSSTKGQITDVLFIASPPTGRPFGLGVVIYQGKVAYPPSVTPVPFATPVRSGAAPAVPEGGKIVPPTATQASSWATATFTARSSSPYALAGKIKVLNQWRPTAGPAALVTRVQVPLRGAPTGSAALTAVAEARSALRAATGKVSGTARALDDANSKLTGDQSALTQANTALAAAQTAAAAGKNSPPLAAAVTAAQANVTKAAQAVGADQAAQASDRAALAAARSAEASARRGLSTAEAALPRVTSVYDVAYDHAGHPLAWVPADYQIGGTS